MRKQAGKRAKDKFLAPFGVGLRRRFMVAPFLTRTTFVSVTPVPNAPSSSEESAKTNSASEKTWSAFFFRNWKWIAGLMVLGFIIDRFDGDSSTAPPQSDTPPSTKKSLASSQQGEAFPASVMSELSRNAFTLRVGMSQAEVMDILGKPPTDTKVTDPAKFTVPGVPIIDPRPFTIYTWSSKDEPGETFVMVAIKDNRVFELSVFEGGGETLSVTE